MADPRPVSTAMTTISEVWIYTKQRRRKPDVFDLVVSPAGLVIQRTGRPDQHMGWDRVTAWGVEARQGYILLTLRGGGSVTPLVVTGWTVNELESVMWEASGTADLASTNGFSPEDPHVAAGPEPHGQGAELDMEAWAPSAWRQLPWKPILTFVVLGVVATAIVVVLLQSAGIITWGFLGPTA